MSGLVQRLREQADKQALNDYGLLDEAADRITELEQALRSIPIHDDDTELEALRTAALSATPTPGEGR